MLKQDQNQPPIDKNNSKLGKSEQSDEQDNNNKNTTVGPDTSTLTTKHETKKRNRTSSHKRHHGHEDASKRTLPSVFSTRHVASLNSSEGQDNVNDVEKNSDEDSCEARHRASKELAYTRIEEFHYTSHNRKVQPSRPVQQHQERVVDVVVTPQIYRRNDTVAPGAYAMPPPPGAGGTFETTPPTHQIHSFRRAHIVHDVEESNDEETQACGVEAKRVESRVIQGNIIVLADQDLTWQKRTWNRKMLLVGILMVVLLCITVGMQFRPTSNVVVASTSAPTMDVTTLPTLQLTIAAAPSLAAEEITCDFLNITIIGDCRAMTAYNGDPIGSTIPTELGTMTQLTHLDLYGNTLSGPIPTEFASLTQLTYLDLCRNALSGPIPTEFASLTQLVSLSLWDNSLSRPIPTELASLTQLNRLSLDGNSLSLSIPTELAFLTQLTWLTLNDNSLSGSIPDSLCSQTDLYIRIDCDDIECSCCY